VEHQRAGTASHRPVEAGAIQAQREELQRLRELLAVGHVVALFGLGWHGEQQRRPGDGLAAGGVEGDPPAARGPGATPVVDRLRATS
jgi:hypothetical protein